VYHIYVDFSWYAPIDRRNDLNKCEIISERNLKILYLKSVEINSQRKNWMKCGAASQLPSRRDSLECLIRSNLLDSGVCLIDLPVWVLLCALRCELFVYTLSQPSTSHLWTLRLFNASPHSLSTPRLPPFPPTPAFPLPPSPMPVAKPGRLWNTL